MEENLEGGRGPPRAVVRLGGERGGGEVSNNMYFSKKNVYCNHSVYK